MKMEQILIFLLLAIGFHTIKADNNTQKCCKDLGCFDLGSPWSSILRPVPPPQCPDECPAEFFMFSRQFSSVNYTVSKWPITSFNSTYFDGNRTTVFLIHGWLGTWKNNSDGIAVKDAYLKRADVNFILLDWSTCSMAEYFQVISTLRTIAAQAVRFIRYLAENCGMSPCKMHIIGESLGAHLGSYIAKDLIDNQTNISCVERLTGLEPAAPFFQGYSDEVQIAKTDAKFVEIAHTETFPIVGPGELKSRGHVDHYFNGNLKQPGCILTAGNNTLQLLKQGNLDALNFVVQFLDCGHQRSLIYYLESLKDENCTFWGETLNSTFAKFHQLTGGVLAAYTNDLRRCTITSCSPFGLKAIEYPARGNFAVFTNKEEPYCIPHPDTDKMMARKLQEYKRKSQETTTTNPSS